MGGGQQTLTPSEVEQVKEMLERQRRQEEALEEGRREHRIKLVRGTRESSFCMAALCIFSNNSYVKSSMAEI